MLELPDQSKENLVEALRRIKEENTFPRSVKVNKDRYVPSEFYEKCFCFISSFLLSSSRKHSYLYISTSLSYLW